MTAVSLFEAKTHLSDLVESLLQGKEDEVVISRHGKPVARLTPLPQTDTSAQIGVAKGRFTVPDDIDASNEVVSELFHSGEPKDPLWL